MKISFVAARRLSLNARFSSFAGQLESVYFNESTARADVVSRN